MRSAEGSNVHSCPDLFFTYDINKFLATLADKEKAKDLYYQLGWYSSSAYFGDLSNEIISNFLIKNKKEVTFSLLNDSNYSKLMESLISHIYKNNYKINPEILYNSLLFYAQDVDDYLDSIIYSLEIKDTINIFSFGVGNGHYEEKVKQKILNEGIAKKVNTYGYEPNRESSSDIHIIQNIEEIFELPQFDFVISRWVLHHMAYEERWKNLIKILNHIKPGTTIVCVEEGCIPSRNNKYDIHIKMYEFLLACVDVIINYGLNNDWILDIVENKKHHFFVDYLSIDDFFDIEKSLTFNFTKNIKKLGPPFFRQTILSYQCKERIREHERTSLLIDTLAD